MLIVILTYEHFLIEGKKEMKVNELLKLTMAAILTIAMASPAFAGADVESYGSLEKEGDVSQFVYDNPSVTVPSKTSSVVGASAIPSRYDLRKLNHFSVNVYLTKIDEMLRFGVVRLQNGLYILEDDSYYNDITGLNTEPVSKAIIL